MTGDLDNQVSVPKQPLEDVEPFLRDTLRESWQAFKRDPTLFIVGTLVATLLSVVSFGLLLGPMLVGLITTIQRRLHGQSARITDIFEGLPTLISSVLASALIAIAAGLGCLLAVVPGLLVLAAACFTFHELCYRRGTAVDAIKGSLLLLKAHLLHVLLILVAIGLLNALAGISLFASLITAPFSLVFMTVAYEKLSGQTTGSALAAPT